ncbi:unnamed protein product, partial [marine sediment metagenome]
MTTFERCAVRGATTSKAILAVVLFAPLLPLSAGAHGPHESFSAGEPGDPAKPSRTIEVVMTEMAFAPELIEVKRGEQVRFVIRNSGKEDHEFMLATLRENLKHGELMKKHPHME